MEKNINKSKKMLTLIKKFGIICIWKNRDKRNQTSPVSENDKGLDSCPFFIRPPQSARRLGHSLAASLIFNQKG